jgi:hypothetical protein
MFQVDAEAKTGRAKAKMVATDAMMRFMTALLFIEAS